MEDYLTDLPKVDVVWCSALLEHVISPHMLLRKIYGLLSRNGIVCVFVPTISPFRFFRHIPTISKYFDGYLYCDHINAFTPSTLRFMCEQAGFSTLESSAFYPWFLAPLNHFSVTDGSVYVGRKIEDWQYPDRAARKAALNSVGYVLK